MANRVENRSRNAAASSAAASAGEVDPDETPAGRDAAAALWRKLVAASAEPGFSGALRRAINAALIPAHQLAAECGIERTALQQFRTGEAELPSGAVDRLVERLGLELAPVEAGHE